MRELQEGLSKEVFINIKTLLLEDRQTQDGCKNHVQITNC